MTIANDHFRDLNDDRITIPKFDNVIYANLPKSMMHVKSCFAHETYCFFIIYFLVPVMGL